jgi:5-methylcytosine-specific restriction endonuclease McrA
MFDAVSNGTPASVSSTNATSDADALVNSPTNFQTGGKESSVGVARTSAEISSPSIVTQPKVFIQFLADQSFMAKYRVATSILSNRLPKLTFESVFTALVEDFIRRNEPAGRHDRRERAAARRLEMAREREAAHERGVEDQRLERTQRLTIPQRTRDAVFARDRRRCTYVGSDGNRCEATLRLHIDHIRPVAHGGSNDISNLRLLCAWHNQLQANKLLGRDVMSGFGSRSDAH